MPIYTYRGPCGHEWDEVRTIEGSEASQESCPVCTAATSGPSGLQSWQALPALGKKIPPTGVTPIFKGEGWTPKFYPNRGK